MKEKFIQEITPKPTVLTLNDIKHFDRGGFEGYIYPDGKILVKVHGEHPKKRIDTGERKYTVVNIKGDGEFNLNGDNFLIKEGDQFIIPAGNEYSYKGDEMTLLEENKPETTSTTLESES